MVSIVALGAVTVGINLTVSNAELRELGLKPGGYTEPTVDQMEMLRIALEHKRGSLPDPCSGGSGSNTAALIARAGISCGMMGVGGNDRFGRFFVSDCEKSSLAFLSRLDASAVTGYDFYLQDDDDRRTIVWTPGANTLLSPELIDTDAIQGSELLLLDGIALSFGPASEAAVSHCIKTAMRADIPFVLTLSSTRIVDEYRAFYNIVSTKAQMVAGNLEQTATLLGLESDSSLGDVRAELARSAINAIVTLDADGVFARFDNEEILLPTYKIDVVDDTGAGDAFLGAFIVARKRGLTLRKALAVGNCIAAQVIQYESARLPIDIDVPALFKQAEVKN